MVSSKRDIEVKTVKVSTKGQTTIPKEIREQVGITPGGEVDIYVENGRVIIEPFPSSPEELRGIHASDEDGPSIIEKSREWDAEEREREEAEMRELLDHVEPRRPTDGGRDDSDT